MARLVLLADDDQIVRSVVQDVLGREGFLVLPASNGEEALDFLEQLVSVEVLITDVYMGKGMNGMELAERVLKMRPGTPVLVISAYFESFPMVFGKVLPYLAKPFSADSLVQRLREVLANGAAATLGSDRRLPDVTAPLPRNV